MVVVINFRKLFEKLKVGYFFNKSHNNLDYYSQLTFKLHLHFKMGNHDNYDILRNYLINIGYNLFCKSNFYFLLD